MSKREPVGVTAARINSRSVIIGAIIGLIGTLIIGYSVNQDEDNYSPTKSSIPIAIDSQKGWQSTDVVVTKTYTVNIIVAAGKWTANHRLLTEAEKTNLPNELRGLNIFISLAAETNGIGTTSTCAEIGLIGCTIPDGKWGALIARIGTDEPFVIGNQSTFIAPSSGLLYLRINERDASLDDNSGILAIFIEISKP